MKAWLDVDNPPQAQYLCPFHEFMRRSGRDEPVFTVRDYGSAVDLVRARGIEPKVFGRPAGSAKLAKALNTSVRAMALVGHVGRMRSRPSYLISSSRSSALAARILGLPSFVFCDYEHAELGSYAKLGSYIIHPDVIPAAHFQGLGFREDRLIGFQGIKEDISFAYADLEGAEPLDLPVRSDLVRVLLRPPATMSHYYRGQSGTLYDRILAELAERDDLQVILSPRYPAQADAALGLSWRVPLHVLDNRADFVSLLKSVDAVISSGGTMLREAVYLGVHACSIFMGPRGAVDVDLAARGLLTFAQDFDTFRACSFKKRSPASALSPRPGILESIIDGIEARISS